MESGNLFGSRFRVVLVLVAEFISIKKVYTFSSIRDHIIPKSIKV